MKREQNQQQQVAARRAEDIRMMLDPSRWPRFGILPVKKLARKPGDLPDCGFMRCWDKVEPIVYLENIYAAGEKYPSKMGPGFIDISKVPQQKYLDFEALASEWTVD